MDTVLCLEPRTVLSIHAELAALQKVPAQTCGCPLTSVMENASDVYSAADEALVQGVFGAVFRSGLTVSCRGRKTSFLARSRLRDIPAL